MAVEIFTRQEFENALPVHKCTGQVLWQHIGLIDGEHSYRVQPFDNIPYAISVRSSVKADGKSAQTGQDSIRAFIIDHEGKPFGSKISRYTTRLPGWQGRLTVILRTLAKMIKEIAPCESCGQPCPPFKVKKSGPNRGRLFSKCINKTCAKPKFTWLTEPDE